MIFSDTTIQVTKLTKFDRYPLYKLEWLACQAETRRICEGAWMGLMDI